MNLFYLFHKPFHCPSEGVIQAKIALNLKGKDLKSEESPFLYFWIAIFKALISYFSLSTAKKI